MSLQALTQGIPFLGYAILGATFTDIIEAENTNRTVHGLNVVETSNNATTLTLQITNGTTTIQLTATDEPFIAKQRTLIDFSFPLPPGWKLQGKASAAARIHVTAPYTRPQS